MSSSFRLSDHCLVDKETHLAGFREQPALARAVRVALLGLQGKMFFTGLAGLAWRLMGVGRSGKNPNLCLG